MFQTLTLSNTFTENDYVVFLDQSIRINFPVRRIEVKATITPRSDDILRLAAVLWTDLMNTNWDKISYFQTYIDGTAATNTTRNGTGCTKTSSHTFQSPRIIDGSYSFMFMTLANEYLIAEYDDVVGPEIEYDAVIQITFFNEL